MRTLGLIPRLSKFDPQSSLSAQKLQNFFFPYLSIFLYFREKIKRYHFSYFEYLSKNSHKLNQNYYWLWFYFGISVSNGQIRITVFNYTVVRTYVQCRNPPFFKILKEPMLVQKPTVPHMKALILPCHAFVLLASKSWILGLLYEVLLVGSLILKKAGSRKWPHSSCFPDQKKFLEQIGLAKISVNDFFCHHTKAGSK